MIGRTVNLNSRGNWAGKKYITYLQDLSMTVYNYISRMQVVLLALISTYVWNQGQANPRGGDTKPLTSKYSAQLFDCGVLGKIQTLQIPETCEDRSAELERETLRETYVLSPRKLKKTSGVMCRATVDSCISKWKVALMIFIYVQPTNFYKLFICCLQNVYL